jgi:hypothetical protein
MGSYQTGRIFDDRRSWDVLKTEVVRGRFPFDALKRKVMEVKQRYGSSTLLIEASPISHDLNQSMRENPASAQRRT